MTWSRKGRWAACLVGVAEVLGVVCLGRIADVTSGRVEIELVCLISVGLTVLFLTLGGGWLLLASWHSDLPQGEGGSRCGRLSLSLEQ